MLKDLMADNFQYAVAEQVLCNGSILDILNRHQECSTKIQRSIIKTVTTCGCVQIQLKKYELPKNASLMDLKSTCTPSVTGSLCPNCREKIENEIGRSLVYLAATCNSLDINLFDVIIKEHHKMQLLGQYNIT
ncbi:DUF1573 domain-containing protein [Peptococcaceae bacterium 1198_IL3148]